MAERPWPTGRRLAVAALALSVLALVGCGSDAPDPEAERLERVEHRLGTSFSDAQAACILDRLDDDELAALDRGKALAADGPALTGWTEAITGCITDGRPTTTTAPVTTTTTTAPGGTSTTAGG